VFSSSVACRSLSQLVGLIDDDPREVGEDTHDLVLRHASVHLSHLHGQVGSGNGVVGDDDVRVAGLRLRLLSEADITEGAVALSGALFRRCGDRLRHVGTHLKVNDLAAESFRVGLLLDRGLQTALKLADLRQADVVAASLQDGPLQVRQDDPEKRKVLLCVLVLKGLRRRGNRDRLAGGLRPDVSDEGGDEGLACSATGLGQDVAALAPRIRGGAGEVVLLRTSLVGRKMGLQKIDEVVPRHVLGQAHGSPSRSL
jgi:hypothetical protein